jgi:hypothetical protein
MNYVTKIQKNIVFLLCVKLNSNRICEVRRICSLAPADSASDID